MHQISMLIEADNLASVSESRVDRHCPFLPYRCRQQELFQVLTENSHRLLVRLLLEFIDDFIGDGRLQKTLVGIIYRNADLLRQRS